MPYGSGQVFDADAAGDDDAVGECDRDGGGSSVSDGDGLGSDGDGLGDLDGVADGDGDDALGAGLGSPTCAAGGNAMTGLPCNAPFIISCHVIAGSWPP